MSWLTHRNTTVATKDTTILPTVINERKIKPFSFVTKTFLKNYHFSILKLGLHSPLLKPNNIVKSWGHCINVSLSQNEWGIFLAFFHPGDILKITVSLIKNKFLMFRVKVDIKAVINWHSICTNWIKYSKEKFSNNVLKQFRVLNSKLVIDNKGENPKCLFIQKVNVNMCSKVSSSQRYVHVSA